MTAITELTYELTLRALRESLHPCAQDAITQLRAAHIESLAREFEFNNEAPALLRAQA
jgi:hypothetical protein